MDSKKSFSIFPEAKPTQEDPIKNPDKRQTIKPFPMQINSPFNLENVVFATKEKLVHSPEVQQRLTSPTEVPQNLSIQIRHQDSDPIPQKVLSLQEKDAEIDRLQKENCYLRKKYLPLLADTTGLSLKIQSQDEYIQKIRGKYKTLKQSSSKTLEPINKDLSCQDIGISPIRALNLTDKNDLDRIDELNKELEDARNVIKLFESKQELMRFTAPDGSIDHLKYYEIIASLWKLVNSMQQYYNDCLQEALRRTEAKCNIYEKQKSMLLCKIKQVQNLHCEKLREMSQIEQERDKALKDRQEIEAKYKDLKEEYNEYKTKVTKYKAGVVEKMAKAKADIDFRVKCEKAEAEIEEYKQKMIDLQKSCEEDKIEFLREYNQEKRELVRKHKEEEEKMLKTIEMLKEMRGGK